MKIPQYLAIPTAVGLSLFGSDKPASAQAVSENIAKLRAQTQSVVGQDKVERTGWKDTDLQEELDKLWEKINDPSYNPTPTVESPIRETAEQSKTILEHLELDDSIEMDFANTGAYQLLERFITELPSDQQEAVRGKVAATLQEKYQHASILSDEGKKQMIADANAELLSLLPMISDPEILSISSALQKELASAKGMNSFFALLLTIVAAVAALAIYDNMQRDFSKKEGTPQNTRSKRESSEVEI